jgi:hypothetical protein
VQTNFAVLIIVSIYKTIIAGRTSMKCKTLINIIGKYNHYSILAALNLKPEKVIFIRVKEDAENFQNTETCISQMLPEAVIIEHIADEKSPGAIAQIIKKYDSINTFINLSGGSKLMSLLTLQAAKDAKVTLIYVDNDNGKILVLNEKLQELMPIKTELTVEDIVCSIGAEIVSYSTDIYDRREFRDLVGYMIANYDMWKSVKNILRNTHIVRQYVLKPLYIEMITYKLSYMQLKFIETFLKTLEEKQLIANYECYYDHIEFTFTERAAKSFVMTAGSWLEALTYSCVKEIREVSNAISGMLFVWDEELQVHNELDVVASVNSHLVCISCKDTEKYDVEALNELEVYAEHLGGRKVTKILVSTQGPERGEMIYQRAEEMGIKLILFQGDVKSFKDKLQKALSQ